MSNIHYRKSVLHCLSNTEIVAVYGKDTIIGGLFYDSRVVTAGGAFFALPGIHTDGEKYMDDAVNRGACAVIYEHEQYSYRKGVCYIQVRNVWAAMSAAAAAFFDNPSKDLTVIGVTGTEGKSSTVAFIAGLLRAADKKVGFFSTVAYSDGGTILPNTVHQTTPESVTVHERLAAMRDNGCEYAVIEASSHGLSPKMCRLADVYFDVAVCMNVTQEHLEFHGTFAQYRHDKAHLFRALDKLKPISKQNQIKRFCVVNIEDSSAAYFSACTNVPVYGFSGQKIRVTSPQYSGIVYSENIQENGEKLCFSLCYGDTGKKFLNKNESVTVYTSVSGRFNVYNLLAAALTVHNLTGISFSALVPLIKNLPPVTGRMSRVDAGQPFEVLIDYAHTPASFESVLPPVAARVKQSGGKVIAVFGSGGERDMIKRPEQGRIASLHCDYIILTDEDPRGESPMGILEMIAEGCADKIRGKNLFLIPHRADAIRKAVTLATPADTVLLLGKGHERSIIYKDYTLPYDEHAQAVAAIMAVAEDSE